MAQWSFRSAWLLLAMLAISSGPLMQVSFAQGEAAPAESAPASESRKAPSAPEKVEVQPIAEDVDISDRLVRIYEATKWFQEIDASVRDGVVFLTGTTKQDKYRDWAETLAQKTEGVVAVVNRIKVTLPDSWDFSPAGDELRQMSQNVVRSLPIAVVALLVLLFSVVMARLARNGMRVALRQRIRSELLREVAARTVGILLLVLGIYLVLRISGLSRLAATVIGGTGLVGLVLGIAFRDITENFLASMFLSIQNPFREGDLVDIGGTMGFVEQLTSRTTVLTTPAGIQVQIPNATVFKSTIRNLSSNPNRQEIIVLGIGLENSIQPAQEAALAVVSDHPAVLADPEPMVLVDSVVASTVNLKIYYWFNAQANSQIKLRSSVIRLVKVALAEAGISLADTAREIVVPREVMIHLAEGRTAGPERAAAKEREAAADKKIVSAGEKGLRNEEGDIKRQGHQGWSPEKGENLLANGDRHA